LLIRLIFIFFLCVNIIQLAVGTCRYIISGEWEYLFGLLVSTDFCDGI